MPEPIPQQVKAEVKKEIDKRPDLSWIRKDYLAVAAIFIVLAVLSTVQILALRENLEQTKRLGSVDRLMECFVPTTPCGEEVARRDAAERDYFVSLLKVTGICTLITSGAVNNEVIPYTNEDMTAHYNACVDERTGPRPGAETPPVINPPNPVTTTSTR